MTPLTNREQWLVRLLPAFLVSAAYGLHYQRSDELARKTAELAAARQAAVSPTAVQAQRRKLDDATTRTAAVQAEAAKLEEARGKVSTGDRWKPAVSAEVFRQVTDLLWDHHLVNFRESQVSDGDNQYPTALQGVLQALVPPSKTLDRPRFWRVEFVGSYGDVLRALENLSASGLPAVPLRISMSPLRSETASSAPAREVPTSDRSSPWIGPMPASFSSDEPAAAPDSPSTSATDDKPPLRVWTLLLWL